jgi:hypothetical protein
MRNLKKVDPHKFWIDFWSLLNNHESFGFTERDANLMLQAYEDCAGNALDMQAPKRLKKIVFRHTKFRFSPTLLHAKKQMRLNEIKWRASQLQIDRDIFKQSRNVYISQLRREKEKHFHSRLIDPENSPKQYWAIMAESTGFALKAARKRKRQQLLTQTESRDKAQRFADFFNDKVETIITQLEPSLIVDKDPAFLPSTVAILPSFDDVDRMEIIKLVRCLQSQKTSAEDVIPVKLMKADVNVCALISNICNASFHSAVFPSILKTASITPVIKSHESEDDSPSNYRPISNLKTISKLLEKVVVTQLTTHLDKVKYLHPHQSAYRYNHSTESATLQVTNSWRAALDRGRIVCVASLDVTAAFDTVNHDILLSRLAQAGVIGRALKWIKSYLTERTAIVCLNGAYSNPFILRSGVPQGSTLGPYLFNCYMADLARELERIDGVNLHIYADDVLIFVECNPQDLSDGTERLQRAILCTETWMKSNSLLLNTKKTELLILHGQRTILPVTIPSIKLGDLSLDFRVHGSFRWLGVNFDVSLSMNEFVNNTCRVCFMQLRMLRQIRKRLNKQSTKLLCHSLVLSRIDYCLTLLASSPQTLLYKLQRVINLGARIVTGSKRSDNITPLLADLKWLSARKRLSMKLILMVFKCVRDLAPKYLVSILEQYKPQRATRSVDSNAILLVLGSAKTRIGMGAFSVAGPSAWNSLPVSLRVSSMRPQSFPTELSNYFMNSPDI